MAWGWNPVIAGQVLDSVFSAAAFTPPAGSFAELHIGDPGVNGTANLSSVTTREAVTWSAAAAGVKVESSPVSWGTWAGASPEIIAGLAFWSASTGGTFIVSAQLLAPVPVVTGTPLSLPSLQIAWGALAA